MSVLRLTSEQLAAYQARRANRAGVVVPASSKPSKHRNQRTNVDGEMLDSKKEAKRLVELRAMGRAGLINELARQVEFFLGVQKDEDGVEHVCKYVADFAYVDLARGGARIVEDVKSVHTRSLPVYRLKKRLMHACLGLEVCEI